MKLKTIKLGKTLSDRISFLIVSAVTLLLTAAITVMFTYLYHTVKKEAMANAELRLEGTVQQIDNVLLDVEQTMGNIYWDLLTRQDHPEMMTHYCQKTVRTNPYITGCAIAFEPHYYKDRGEYFLRYIYEAGSDSLVVTTSPVMENSPFGTRLYTEQPWYKQTMESGQPTWSNPSKYMRDNSNPVISFCLPIYGKEGRAVGVFGADVSLEMLSNIVAGARPTAHAYATLIDKEGYYIVHNDDDKLGIGTVFTQTGADTDPALKQAIKDMTDGKTGHSKYIANDTTYYTFYKPFKRAEIPGRDTNELDWNVGIIYPDGDIYGDYYRLCRNISLIALGALFLLLLLIKFIMHHQLLPLRLLTHSAQLIAEGKFGEPIPDTLQQDEIGVLQRNFKIMQQALADNLSEQEQLNSQLKARGEVLSDTYRRARQADVMKTAVLHNMSNQMTPPITAINADVAQLCARQREISQEEANSLAANIQENGEKVASLLNELLEQSSKENTGKSEK